MICSKVIFPIATSYSVLAEGVPVPKPYLPKRFAKSFARFPLVSTLTSSFFVLLIAVSSFPKVNPISLSPDFISSNSSGVIIASEVGYKTVSSFFIKSMMSAAKLVWEAKNSSSFPSSSICLFSFISSLTKSSKTHIVVVGLVNPFFSSKE